MTATDDAPTEGDDEVPDPSTLRIVSLLPSATEIVGALGLRSHLVGVTHECDVCPDVDGMRALMASGSVKRVTASSMDPRAMTQGEIDATIKSHVATRANDDGGATTTSETTLPPLYTLDDGAMTDLKPTVVLTQSLCGVCGITEGDVAATATATAGGVGACAVSSSAPGTLAEVAASIESIARACGVPSRGRRVRERFERDLRDVEAATRNGRKSSVLLLEWIDPVFDGGHWVPGMIAAAGGVPLLQTLEGAKSAERSWDDVAAADPDVVVVACCGFDLARNAKDARDALKTTPRFASLRAVRDGRAFAVDGNRFFARPSPALAAGCAIVARCAHDDDEEIARAVEALEVYAEGGLGDAWARVDTSADAVRSGDPASAARERPAPAVADVEDAWAEMHASACARGEHTYVDPSTGYVVMTAVKLKARGRCCGSGCRHCPYAHECVPEDRRAATIQVPAPLHVSSSGNAKRVVALLWSGGKDSFLALRAMLRPGPGGGILGDVGPRGVVLVTTFDARTRMIAHQDVHLRDVERQAKHLDVTLIGVPLHGGGGAGSDYVARLKLAVDVIEGKLGSAVDALACGDLHLEHIRKWREDAVGKALVMKLAYPVWSDDARSNYDALREDLDASGVRCVVTAVTTEAAEAAGAKVGARYDGDLARAMKDAGVDAFGEDGEFHTLAEVWSVSRERALGLKAS